MLQIMKQTPEPSKTEMIIVGSGYALGALIIILYGETLAQMVITVLADIFLVN